MANTVDGVETAVEPFDAFEDLLAALARGPDIRDIFRHLSAVFSRIVPHEEAHLAVLTGDDDRILLYTATRDGAAEVRAVERKVAIADADQPRLLDVVPGTERGLQSGLSVPVRIDGRLVGVFALFSRRQQIYSDDDLVHAETLAGYLAVALAHERLAQHAREAAVERERTASIEASMELLQTIADVLDIRTVFSRVSEIANKMLPHDRLVMAFIDREGNLIRQAASTDDVPNPPTRVKLTTARPEAFIIDDLRADAFPNPAAEDLRDQAVRAGYRSLLSVFTHARDQVMFVGFYSKQLHAFHPHDLPVARRIADHIALAVSHERLAEAAREIAEARGRADRLEARVRMLSEELESKTHVRVVGESAAWRDVLKKATKVAATDTTVLLTGESGTGKEVVARFLHRASPRNKGAFIALNCAALPEQLLESELFGYERGAFTSAHQAKPGQIELAAGGVLFLDEVSEMSLSAQAKFLRVLQEHEFQRLGGTRSLKANIRVVAASNRDLRKAVDGGTFREDLFYRLQVFDIHIPPLRERRGDILPLSDAFLQDISKSFGRPPAGLTRDAREALLRYDWPGNVRELRNALERAAILAEGGLIDTAHLTLQGAGRTAQEPTADLSTIERDTIAHVLQDTKWNRVKSAKRLGLSRTQLYNRMRKYGLE